MVLHGDLFLAAIGHPSSAFKRIHQRIYACTGYNVVLSLLIATGTNVIGWAICVVTKTHKVTDLIVRLWLSRMQSFKHLRTGSGLCG